MSTPILATKLYIPPLRPQIVLRPRLIERLNQDLHRKLTLISAPAGFGKTTLVGAWADHFSLPILDFGVDSPAFWLTSSRLCRRWRRRLAQGC